MSRKTKNKKLARMPTSTKGAQINRKIYNTGYSESGGSHIKSSMMAWNPIRSSPASDIDMNLSTLRARSADLYMGTPVAAGAINTSRTNVIGAGLHLSPRPKYKLLGISAEESAEWARKTKGEFELWAISKFCDITHKNNFYDMQDIAYINYLIDGNSFAIFNYRQPTIYNPYALRIKMVEASRISNPNSTNVNGPVSPWTITTTNPDNGNKIINGVEIDNDGAIVAYFVCNKYPYDPTNMKAPEWIRIEAFGEKTGQPNILQICHDERPEQYRGVPYLSPVLETVKQLGRYQQAELMAAVIKSFFTIFITEEAGSGGDFPLNSTVTNNKRVTLDKNKLELAAGTINNLPPGYDVKTVDAQRSMSTFVDFFQENVKQIGAALEIPDEVITKHFASSYTAARGALLQAWSVFKMRRTWFTRDFNQPVYETWLAEAIAIGRVEAPGFFEDPLKRLAWCNAEWYGPVMGILDPVKEIEGAVMRQQVGIETGEQTAAEMTGTSYEENLERLAIERAQRKKLGLPADISISKSLNTQQDNTTTNINEGGE